MKTINFTMLAAAALALTAKAQVAPCEFDPENPDCPYETNEENNLKVCCDDPECPDYPCSFAPKVCCDDTECPDYPCTALDIIDLFLQ